MNEQAKCMDMDRTAESVAGIGGNADNRAWFIIRTDRAGVFFGHIKERVSSEVTLTDVRRLWYWSGAASLSEMATSGVKDPGNCKFTVRVPEMTVLGVIEVIPCAEEAACIINEVPEWKA